MKEIEEVVKETPEEPKKRTVKKAEPPKPEKSKRRITMKEYMMGKRIRREVQAAIRVKLGGDLFHSKEEWDKIVKEHIGE
ncbi:MAG: hypothetical protein GXZ11_01375 [Tissierellia bacterium]|nr:hypothetical protein [Tissierellia bacterium]